MLAEKLWTDQKYAAAVSEFEKVATRDPKSKLGLQALYRAAMTQWLFLSQYADAIRKFKTYIQDNPDAQSVWAAEIQVGEILFSKLEQYDQAIVHYRMMLKKKPQATEAPELLYRIGRSYFFLLQFNEATHVYRELIQKFPQSFWAEKASFEIGATYFTQAEQHSNSRRGGGEDYQVAVSAFREFIRKYPKSSLVPEAAFGIASCLEELDDLKSAFEAYSALKETYPDPHVIEIKLARIRERLLQKGR